MTTRGLNADDFVEIADIIADRLLNPENDSVAQACRQRLAALCDRYPLYAHLDHRTPVVV